MNDELLKQLKDAGFEKSNNAQWFQEKDYPTLSELIGACGGDRFYGLNYNRSFKIKWLAEGMIDDDTIIGENGTTPEEAVAKLWLELNNK